MEHFQLVTSYFRLFCVILIKHRAFVTFMGKSVLSGRKPPRLLMPAHITLKRSYISPVIISLYFKQIATEMVLMQLYCIDVCTI